jgi:uncharacterized lipoprotein YajG
MKKSIILIGAALTMMTACQKQETATETFDYTVDKFYD